jgi:hypothetical protein
MTLNNANVGLVRVHNINNISFLADSSERIQTINIDVEFTTTLTQDQYFSTIETFQIDSDILSEPITIDLGE